MDLSDFLSRLKFVPSFFTLDPPINLSELKTVHAKMEHPEENPYIDFVNDNLASFLCFNLQNFTDCKKKYEVTLKKNPDNIQANVIKCVLKWERLTEAEAEECLEKLETLSKDGFLMAEAKSELAYVFSRMGRRYYKRAIALYDEAMALYDEAIALYDAAIAKHPIDYVWKYRQAVCLRRCLDPSVITFLPVEPNQVETFHRCKNLFEVVINNSKDHILRAYCFVELAVLYFGDTADNLDLKKLDLTPENRKDKALNFLERAEECPVGSEKEKVLTETGRVLRSMGEFQKARDVLEKAVKIRETTNNCQHLALTLEKLDGCRVSAIDYCQKWVDISKGSASAVEKLGLMYEDQSPPNYDEALKCFKRLINDYTYPWRRNGNERASHCYLRLHWKDEKQENSIKTNKCRTQCIINAALACLQQPPNLKEKKIPIEELFRDKQLEENNSQDNNNYQYKRVARRYKKLLNFFEKIQSALRSSNVNGAVIKIALDLLDSKKYEDCLDLTTMLLVTTIPHIEKVAVDIMMTIVRETSEIPNELATKCFTRAVVGLCTVEEGAAHVRIIYDVNTSKDEFELLEEWLTGVDLKVAKNDEEILSYLDRQEALVSALSSNIVIICLFKGDNTKLLEDYPIISLPQNKPIIIPVRVDKSAVAPVVDKRQFMDFPDVSRQARPSSSKEFCCKLFSDVVKFTDYT